MTTVRPYGFGAMLESFRCNNKLRRTYKNYRCLSLKSSNTLIPKQACEGVLYRGEGNLRNERTKQRAYTRYFPLSSIHARLTFRYRHRESCNMKDGRVLLLSYRFLCGHRTDSPSTHHICELLSQHCEAANFTNKWLRRAL